MPFLAPIGAAIAVAAKAVTVAIAAGGIVGTLARTALYVVADLLLSKPKGKTPPDEGLELRKRIATDHPIEVLFGETATPGSLQWWGIRGDDNEFYEQVLALSDYTCDSIQKVYGDGVELTFSGDLTTGYRPCTSHYLDEDGNPCLWVKIYLGDPAQTADADLVSNYTEITTDFRGRGRAYAITRAKWNRDAFPNGEPGLLFVMRGAPIYDPRLDTTAGGSGSHRSNDPTSWEWSDNPALIGAQYIQGFSLNGSVFCGMGYDRERIPAADLIEAANECDQSVSLKAGGSENRYRCGGSFLTGKTGRTHQGNMSIILAAMDAELDDGNGREFRFLPGVERTPVSLEIAWDDIIGEDSIQLSPNLDPAERVNTVLGQFTDPASVYEKTPIPIRQNATYVTEDNGQEYFYEPFLLAVQSGTQAQRIVKRAMERARAERRLALVLPLTYARLEKGDRVNLDATLEDRLRLPDTVWRVERRPTIRADLKCEIVLREHPASVGDWTPATDELDGSEQTFTVPSIPSLALTSPTVSAVGVTQGSAEIPYLRVTWTAGDSRVDVKITATRMNGASPPAEVVPKEVITATVKASDGQVDLPVVPGAQYKVDYVTSTGERVAPVTSINAAITATTGLQASVVVADWNSDITSRPTELTDGRVAAGLAASGDVARAIPAGIKTSSDILSRTGGGTFTGELTATEGADWSTNLVNRPTELTDGRVAAGLEVTGAIKVAVPGAVKTASDILSRSGGGTYTGDLNANRITATSEITDDAGLGDTAVWSNVTGAGKPADNATVGATWGTNITNEPTALADINSGEGSKLSGIAAGATVGATWGTNITNEPTTLADINSGEGTKLSGIAAGATVGATWGSNITNEPTALADINAGEGSKLSGIADGATANTGALADKDTVAAGDIDSGAITAVKIASGAVTATKIGTSAVSSTKLATSAVITDKIAANAVTNASSNDADVGDLTGAIANPIELVRDTITLTSGSTALIDYRVLSRDILSASSDIIGVQNVIGGSFDYAITLVRDPDGAATIIDRHFLRQNYSSTSWSDLTFASFIRTHEDTGHSGGSTTYSVNFQVYTAGTTTTVNNGRVRYSDLNVAIRILETKR